MAISRTSAVFRKTGDTLDFTPGADVAEGKIIVERGFVCLAQRAIPAGVSGALKILQRGEVVEIATDEAIGATDAGTAIYVTPAGLVTKDADDGDAESPTAYKLLGYTAADVATADREFSVVCA